MAEPRRRWRRSVFWIVMIALVVGGLRLLADEELRARFSGDAVAVIYVEGPISDAGSTVDAVERLRKNDSVRAVVIRVDSPGGGVAPSQELYDAVRRLRDEKPVVASLGGLAASGGYYVASAANEIVSNAGTLTGSIGVIMQFGNVEELLGKIGFGAFVLKAGRLKDVGSPLREMTEEERLLIEELLDNVHDQFVRAVADGRGLEASAVREFADGRLFSGEQALERGLVDRLGGLREAVELAARKAGIEGEPIRFDVRPEAEPWWWERIFGALSVPGLPSGQGLGFLFTGPSIPR